jgi:hypothetical protein
MIMQRMKRKRRRLLTAAIGVAVVGTFAAVALGSPGSGRVTTVLVTEAENIEDVQLNSDRIKFQTKGPTDVRVQTITFAPGGRSGWNHKPGFVLVAVLSGEVTKFDSHCNGTTYGPNSPNGAVFMEYGDEPEEVRNISGAPATVYATLVAPDADPAVFRIEDDPPPCA